MKIKYVNTDAVKGTLPIGTLGYDAYVAGGDEGRVGVGTASGDVLLAKKSEVDGLDTRVAAIEDNTTLAEYGITDAYTKTETNTAISTAVSGLVDSSPTTLDTLNELAAALGDDPNFATTVSTALGERVVKNIAITAGTGTKVTYDAKGLVTESTTPTTLSGYSIGDAYTKTEVNDSLSSVNLLRADKYLAAQNVANMIYTVGKLSKVRYIADTDTNYETMTYNVEGKLSNVAHYIATVLTGNTVLSYTDGKLVSAMYTGV